MTRKTKRLAPFHAACFTAAVVILAVASSSGTAQDEATAPQTDSASFSDQQLEFFENKVRPLLVTHCYDCHGPDADPVEGGLGLASRQAILEGGDSGPAIDLDEPAESLLLSAVEYGDLFEMPPDSKLPNEEIEILRRWVREGAPWPDENTAGVNRGEEFNLEARRAAHWCWQPISRPAAPNIDSDSALDPLDSFILSKLQEQGLEPAPAADRRTWLRRVTLDLTGIPPTRAEIEQFVTDESDDAYETVVDRLLASPRYGERWARHWMDLIRYAETCGHEFDYPNPNAWQYRDYLIRAFNADVAYDDFVTEHIAGDLLIHPRRNPKNQINESVLGTGFWFLGEATHGPVDVKGDEAGRIDNQIDVMSKTFLGVTVACARCHDHKFDAIAAADYYAMCGFLQSSRRQEVMLDPDRKIERAWNNAQQVAHDAGHQIKDAFYAHILEHGEFTDELTTPIKAAVLLLRENPGWFVPAEVLLEGESLVNAAKGPGKISRQNINNWSDGAQLWWTEGKIDNTISIDLTVEHASKYELVVEFTKAPDYGIVQVIFNGNPVGDPVDLYDERVTRSGEMNFGEFDLKAGPHQFQLRITGKNDKAVDRYMAGIDYLVLRNKVDHTSDMAAISSIEAFAEEFELDPDVLANWVTAVADPATNRTSNPLHLLRRAAETELELDTDEAADFFRDQVRMLQDVAANYSAFFRDAERPGVRPKQWAATGFAFQGRQGFGLDASDPDAPLPGFGIHSGRSGTRFQGVLRSPTFEITKPRIAWLVKAKGAKIRVIIDGFRLDTYNPLLFNGASIDVDTDGQWKWIEQSGDLKNYLGHRAFVEVIDPGDGYIAIADMRFVDEAPPKIARPLSRGFLPQPHQWRSDNSLELLSRSIAKIADRIIRTGPGYGDDINFIYRHRLIPDLDYAAVDRIISESLQAFDRINDEVPDPIPAIGMTEGTPENEYVFIRGNHKNLGDLVPRAPLAALNEKDTWTFNPETSGRLELARHIISLDNPLTRRVIVNRIWHHLTGRGLVASVDNFGVLGAKSSHRELLDYLASEFSDGGWSIKALIRRIALSQTYRMNSGSSKAAIEIDPDNVFLHSARVRRMQGESIRDSILALSGQLDDTMYGPPIPIHLTEFMQGRGRPGKSGPLDGNGRRSIYLEVRRNFLSPMMLAFDTPIPFNTIGRRNQSNVPAQALILLNDPFVVDQAGKWAKQIVDSESDPQQRIEQMYVAALGRPPSAKELQQAIEFIGSQTKLLADDAKDESVVEHQVWTDLCHVMFNLKEFVFVR